MIPSILLHLVGLGLLSLHLRASPIYDPINFQPSVVTAGNGTLEIGASQCSRDPDWIGGGMSVNDCQAAIAEMYHDDVVPRRKQEYEFLRRGVTRHSDLPWVTTPRKHWYGK